MTELRRRFPGIRITRSDLTNWVIQNRPVELTLAEHREVQKGFYDDLHFTAWALKELKSAQERGEKLSLKEIFERNKPLEAIPRKPRRKEPPTVASEVPKS